MNTKYLLLSTLAGAMLFACNHKPVVTDSPKEDSISNPICEVSDTMELRTYVTQLYNDILPRYYNGEEGMEYAFKNYASSELLKVLSDADKVSQESGNIILGWDCDPWIFAQDWSQPKAYILKASTESSSRGYVDVLIKDGDDIINDRKIRFLLIKEKGEWKVNDFIGTESSDNAPTFTEVLREEMANLSE